MAALAAARARLADLRRQAEELAPVFLALTPWQQANLLEQCGCNIVVMEVLQEAMTPTQLHDMGTAQEELMHRLFEEEYDDD